MTRIIGIDPGSHITGYGVIDVVGNKIEHVDCGGIHTNPKMPIEERLQFIHKKISEILEKFQPDSAGVEDVFFAKNAKSSLMLGHVRGVVLLALANHGIPFTALSPREVKQAVCGYGAADKSQVQMMVKTLLRLKEIAFEDASDALAIAITHGNSINLQKRLIKK